LTPNHLKLLKRYTENIIFAFDNDEAGFQATLRATKIAFENEIYPKIFLLPEKIKDFDEAVNQLGEQNFQNLILDDSNYQDSFSFILQKLKNKYSLSDPIERKKFINEVFDLLAYLKDYNILQIYIEHLAEILKTDPYILLKQFKTFLRKNKIYKTSTQQVTKPKNPDTDYLVGALIYEDFIEYLPIQKKKDQILDILALISGISSYLPESVIYKILEENLSDTEKEKLKEASLWREQQTDNIDNFIFSLLVDYLQKLLKIIIKKPSIPEEEKLSFIKEINKIIKTSIEFQDK
jgi:DNA primase